MISDHAEYSLIEISCFWWIECNYYPRWWVIFNVSLCLAEWEYIALICNELESGWQVACVYHVEQSVCISFNLYLTKVNWLCRQFNVITFSKTFGWKPNLVTTKGRDPELYLWIDPGYFRCVAEANRQNLSRTQSTLLDIDFDWWILAIIRNFLNLELSWDQTWVL